GGGAGGLVHRLVGDRQGRRRVVVGDGDGAGSTDDRAIHRRRQGEGDGLAGLGDGIVDERHGEGWVGGSAGSPGVGGGGAGVVARLDGGAVGGGVIHAHVRGAGAGEGHRNVGRPHGLGDGEVGDRQRPGGGGIGADRHRAGGGADGGVAG